MCGIAGINSSSKDSLNVARLARELLLAIEPRGRDATGAAWYTADGKMLVQKDRIPAAKLVPRLEVPRNARNVLLHTRWATKGLPADPANNHPIDVPGLIGIHNGHVSNDDEIFAELGAETTRYGLVDSEAIFAALAATTGPVVDVLSGIEGTAAVAWINHKTAPNTLHLARVDHSPLCWGQTKGGSFVFASTPEALTKACRAARVSLTHVASPVAEGTYLRVRQGRVCDVLPIPGKDPLTRVRRYLRPDISLHSRAAMWDDLDTLAYNESAYSDVNWKRYDDWYSGKSPARKSTASLRMSKPDWPAKGA